MSDEETEDDDSVEVAYTGTDPPEDGDGGQPPADAGEEAPPPETEGAGGSGAEPPESADAADDPFAELASEIDREAGFDEGAFSIGGEASGDDAASPFDELDSDVDDVDLDELFEEMFTEGETGDVGSEAVWDQLEGDEAEPEGGPTDEHVVSARSFCAQCEYAAEPPEVRCTYEGSEIVEFIDKDTVRVRNCPVVKQRRDVGEIE